MLKLDHFNQEIWTLCYHCACHENLCKKLNALNSLNFWSTSVFFFILPDCRWAFVILRRPFLYLHKWFEPFDSLHNGSIWIWSELKLNRLNFSVFSLFNWVLAIPCRGRHASKHTEEEEDEEYLKEEEDALRSTVGGGGTRLLVQPSCE